MKNARLKGMWQKSTLGWNCLECSQYIERPKAKRQCAKAITDVRTVGDCIRGTVV